MFGKRPSRQPRRRETIETTTVRDFGGGLNVVDNDLNLSSRFAKVLKNMFRAPDGSVQVRWGTRLFANIRTVPSLSSDALLNMTYFNNRIIFVSAGGTIGSITSAGVITVHWTGWSAGIKSVANFAQFRGSLIIVNGIDKPVIMNNTFSVSFLQDLATSSNINVPITRFVAAYGNYLVMAGDALNEDRVHISNKYASGTWFGDAPPNDATRIDLGSIITTGSQRITGLVGFRDKLLVSTASTMIPGTLGIYDSSNAHTPDFKETIEQYGAISHRSMQSLGDDVYFADLVGVPALTRTVYNASIRPSRISQLIDPEIQDALGNITTLLGLEQNVFSVYNQAEGQYMLFIPNASDIDTATESKCFVYTSIPTLDVKAWSIFEGWNFCCACRSLEGRIFFGSRNGRIYVYGNKQDEIHADLINDPDVGVAGKDIEFDWQWPWADFDKRMNIKISKYIQFDTKGGAEFTCSMFIDNAITDVDGNYSPIISMDLVGGDAPGFGGGEQPYGAGRRAVDERLWAWPSKFKIAKLRFHGATKEALKIVAITLGYSNGSIRR
jgi:hypothetical protein